MEEQLEAMGADIDSIKKSINDLSNQIFNLNIRFINNERYSATSRLQVNLLWALWILTPMQNNPNTQLRAANCIRHARESAAAALTEIAYTATPYETMAKWYSDCAKYFKDNGQEIFP